MGWDPLKFLGIRSDPEEKKEPEAPSRPFIHKIGGYISDGYSWAIDKTANGFEHVAWVANHKMESAIAVKDFAWNSAKFLVLPEFEDRRRGLIIQGATDAVAGVAGLIGEGANGLYNLGAYAYNRGADKDSQISYYAFGTAMKTMNDVSKIHTWIPQKDDGGLIDRFRKQFPEVAAWDDRMAKTFGYKGYDERMNDLRAQFAPVQSKIIINAQTGETADNPYAATERTLQFGTSAVVSVVAPGVGFAAVGGTINAGRAAVTTTINTVRNAGGRAAAAAETSTATNTAIETAKQTAAQTAVTQTTTTGAKTVANTESVLATAEAGTNTAKATQSMHSAAKSGGTTPPAPTPAPPPPNTTSAALTPEQAATETEKAIRAMGARAPSKPRVEGPTRPANNPPPPAQNTPGQSVDEIVDEASARAREQRAAIKPAQPATPPSGARTVMDSHSERIAKKSNEARGKLEKAQEKVAEVEEKLRVLQTARSEGTITAQAAEKQATALQKELTIAKKAETKAEKAMAHVERDAAHAPSFMFYNMTGYQSTGAFANIANGWQIGAYRMGRMMDPRFDNTFGKILNVGFTGGAFAGSISDDLAESAERNQQNQSVIDGVTASMTEQDKNMFGDLNTKFSASAAGAGPAEDNTGSVSLAAFMTAAQPQAESANAGATTDASASGDGGRMSTEFHNRATGLAAPLREGTLRIFLTPEQASTLGLKAAPTS